MSLYLVAPGRFEWREEQLPQLANNDVLLKTRIGSISSGSESALFLGVSGYGFVPTYPYMTGYETVATVLDAGERVAKLKPGDRVVARYGHRSLWLAHERNVVKVDPDIEDEVAILLVLACDCNNAISGRRLNKSHSALVSGGGQIGLLTAFNLLARGIRRVDIAEPDPNRHPAAVALDVTMVGTSEQFSKFDYDLGFECADSQQSFEFLQTRVKEFGRIALVADGNRDKYVLTPAFLQKSLSVHSVSDANRYSDYSSWFFSRARDGWGVRLRRIFGPRISPKEIPQCIERISSGRSDTPIKYLVDYSALAAES